MPLNIAPTIDGIPVTPTIVTPTRDSDLDDIEVSDIDSTLLSLSLVATNGVINGLVDEDLLTAGIQVTGDAGTLNALLADMTFTATASGAASIALTVSDDLGDFDTATYDLLAGNTPPVFQDSSGRETIDIGGYPTLLAMTVQTDNKVVLAGVRDDSSGSDFALTRFNADGSVDMTFGGGAGFVITDMGADDAIYGVTTQTDGKIVVAGVSVDGSDSYFAVARYNTDGTLDSSFDGDGQVLTTLGIEAGIQSVGIQADGKIVVAGFSDDGSTSSFAVVRYNTDGSLDTGFGIAGVQLTDFSALGLGADSQGFSLAIQADQSILVVGTSNVYGEDDIAIVRYTSSGVLDSTFGIGGLVVIDAGLLQSDEAYSVALQSDGKIVIAGVTGIVCGCDDDFLVMRFNTDGSIDTTFGEDGRVVIDLGGADEARNVTIQPDGKLLVTGTADSYTAAVIRLTSDGDLDTTFSGDGIIAPERASGPSAGVAGHVLADGSIVVGESTTFGFVMQGYNADGTVNTDLVPSTLDNTIEYIAGTSAVLLAPNLRLFDAELAALDSGAGNYNGATLALLASDTLDVLGATGNLSFVSGDLVLSGVIIGSVDDTVAGQLTIVFNGNASQARLDEAVKLLTFSSDSAICGCGEQVAWIFLDGNTDDSQGEGGEQFNYGLTNITITGVVRVGTSGDDSIDGGSGTDTLSGLAGNDSLYGYEGKDALLGDEGRDRLDGDEGNDTLDGGDNEDILIGGLGADSMTGGNGSDRYYVDNAGDLVVETEASAALGGTDTVYTSIGSYTLTANVERGVINTSSAADLTGNTLANRLYAGSGDNVIDGASGKDTVTYELATSGVTVSLAASGAQDTYGSGFDELISIDNLVGSDHGDTLIGNTGANTLAGGDGGDNIAGDAGNDNLNGGRGADTLEGGDGNDRYYVDDAGDQVVETEADASIGGTDSVYSYLSDYTLTDYVERGVIKTSGAANLTGNELANNLYGNSSDNDLYGLAGNDYLSGGAGNDTLAGGLGGDKLTGGLGNDVFVIESSGGRDVITDFEFGGNDKISLQYDLNGSGITDGASALAHTMDIGGKAVVKLGDGNLLILTGVLTADLTAADFMVF